MLKTPVLFLIFNRPDVTKRVFEAIRNAKPERLYVAADGPRDGKEGEEDKCKQTRAIIDEVDWDCEVKRLFRGKNLGCKVAVSSAIDWFFENEEEGIILEDDCLPDPSFFTFCQELLSYYRNNERVMHISGDNFQSGITRGNASYYLSRYNHVWGWASWRRAWKHYDVNAGALNSFIEKKKIRTVTTNYLEQIYWLQQFKKTKTGKIDTWDYQWTFSIWNHSGLSIIPNVNLVSNIGSDLNATHDNRSNLLNLPVSPINTIKHPPVIEPNPEADNYSFNHLYKKNIAAELLMLGRHLVNN